MADYGYEHETGSDALQRRRRAEAYRRLANPSDQQVSVSIPGLGVEMEISPEQARAMEEGAADVGEWVSERERQRTVEQGEQGPAYRRLASREPKRATVEGKEFPAEAHQPREWGAREHALQSLTDVHGALGGNERTGVLEAYGAGMAHGAIPRSAELLSQAVEPSDHWMMEPYRRAIDTGVESLPSMQRLSPEERASAMAQRREGQPERREALRQGVREFYEQAQQDRPVAFGAGVATPFVATGLAGGAASLPTRLAASAGEGAYIAAQEAPTVSDIPGSIIPGLAVGGGAELAASVLLSPFRAGTRALRTGAMRSAVRQAPGDVSAEAVRRGARGAEDFVSEFGESAAAREPVVAAETAVANRPRSLSGLPNSSVDDEIRSVVETSRSSRGARSQEIGDLPTEPGVGGTVGHPGAEDLTPVVGRGQAARQRASGARSRRAAEELAEQRRVEGLAMSHREDVAEDFADLGWERTPSGWRAPDFDTRSTGAGELSVARQVDRARGRAPGALERAMRGADVPGGRVPNALPEELASAREALDLPSTTGMERGEGLLRRGARSIAAPAAVGGVGGAVLNPSDPLAGASTGASAAVGGTFAGRRALSQIAPNLQRMALASLTGHTLARKSAQMSVMRGVMEQSGGLGSVMRAMGRVPERIGAVLPEGALRALEAAAERGPWAAITTHHVLHQSDPEYRQGVSTLESDLDELDELKSQLGVESTPNDPLAPTGDPADLTDLKRQLGL